MFPRTSSFIVAGVLLAVACEPAKRSDHSYARPARVTAVDWVDSVAIHDDLNGVVYLRRVAVRTDRSTDTLRGVVTLQRPIVVGDSVVYGFIYDGIDVVAAGFRYQPGDGVERLAWPEAPIFNTAPAFAPDARHVAYVARDSQGVHPVVLSWPARAIVLRGPIVHPLQTDAGIDDEVWTGPDTVEIEIALALEGQQPERRILRYRADVARRIAISDTVIRLR